MCASTRPERGLTTLCCAHWCGEATFGFGVRYNSVATVGINQCLHTSVQAQGGLRRAPKPTPGSQENPNTVRVVLSRKLVCRSGAAAPGRGVARNIRYSVRVLTPPFGGCFIDYVIVRRQRSTR